MTWQAGGTAGDPSCENRPTGFFFSAEGRESRVGRYLGLMPGVDVRRQDKNQRKFSGGEAQIGQLDQRTKPQERKQRFTRTWGTDKLQIGSPLLLYASLEFNFYNRIL